MSPTTTTRDSQPHVTLSIASARIARLASASAIAILRRARTYITGIASNVMTRPGQENASPVCVQSFQAAAATT